VPGTGTGHTVPCRSRAVFKRAVFVPAQRAEPIWTSITTACGHANAPRPWPCLALRLRTCMDGDALDHPHSSNFISSFKTEYVILLIQVISFIFTSLVSIILYTSILSQQLSGGTHTSASPYHLPPPHLARSALPLPGFRRDGELEVAGLPNAGRWRQIRRRPWGSASP
jgi:hypothetical protein